MSLTLERVRVADILPLVDEYGNEFLNRDYSLEVNKEYVSELAASFGESGEPDEPVKLVRDGGIFRIKAGNSRVRAMKELGTEECWAVIDDVDTVQSVLETVVRTNTKKKYEALEESRFTQQLAMFGDDEYVGRVSGIGSERASQMRRARAMAGERAEELSLERLFALSEFDGDDEAAGEIMGSSEDTWKSVVGRLRREKANREQKEALLKRAAELRITVEEERPKGGFICECSCPDDMEGDYMAVSVDYKGIVGYISDNWSGVTLDLYGEPLHASEEDAAEAERRRLGGEYTRIAKMVDDSLVEWLGRQFDGAAAGELPDSLQALAEKCCKAGMSLWTIKKALSKYKFAHVAERDLVVFLAGYEDRRKYLSTYASHLAEDEPSDYFLVSIAEALEWVDLHAKDGWKPEEGMASFLELARDKVADQK